MIYNDTPMEYQVPGLMRGRKFMSSHMFSDLLGDEGKEELLAFGRKIGQKWEWLQKRNDPVYCHFDVMNTRYQVAIDAGATAITAREAGRIWIKKRKQLNGQTRD